MSRYYYTGHDVIFWYMGETMGHLTGLLSHPPLPTGSQRDYKEDAREALRAIKISRYRQLGRNYNAR